MEMNIENEAISIKRTMFDYNIHDI